MMRVLVALIVAALLLEGVAVYLGLNYGAFAPSPSPTARTILIPPVTTTPVPTP